MRVYACMQFPFTIRTHIPIHVHAYIIHTCLPVFTCMHTLRRSDEGVGDVLADEDRSGRQRRGGGEQMHAAAQVERDSGGGGRRAEQDLETGAGREGSVTSPSLKEAGMRGERVRGEGQERQREAGAERDRKKGREKEAEHTREGARERGRAGN